MEVVQGWHYDHGKYRVSVALNETDLARLLVNHEIPAARLKDAPEGMIFKLLWAECTLFNHNSYLRFLRQQNAQDTPSAREHLKELQRARKERDDVLAELSAWKPPAKGSRNGKGRAGQEPAAPGTEEEAAAT